MVHPDRLARTDETEWLTLGQAAAFLGVAESTVRRWSDVGRLQTFFTPGGHRRFARHDLEALIARGPDHDDRASADRDSDPGNSKSSAHHRDDGVDLGGH